MKNSKFSLPLILSVIALVVLIAIPFIAFDGSRSITIAAPSGSYAEKYAKDNKIDFRTVDEFEESSDGESFSFKESDGKVTVTGSKKGGTVVIPSDIDGSEVTAINIDAIKDEIDILQIPSSVTSVKGTFKTSRYTAPFFTAIVIILLGFLFALASALVGMGKAKTAESVFYGIPFVIKGIAAFAVIAIWSEIAIFLRVQIKIQAIVGIIMFALAVALLALRSAARDSIEETGAKVKAQTVFIKLLSVDAQSLVSRAKSDEAKKSANRVYEAVRFSDPMSTPELGNVENRISVVFNDYSRAVRTDNIDSIRRLESELTALIDERNNFCKALK